MVRGRSMKITRIICLKPDQGLWRKEATVVKAFIETTFSWGGPADKTIRSPTIIIGSLRCSHFYVSCYTLNIPIISSLVRGVKISSNPSLHLITRPSRQTW